MANEKRLIYLEDAYEAVTDLSGQAETKSAYAAFWKAGKELEKLPTVDAAPVVRGEWSTIEDDYTGLIALQCSECNQEYWFEDEPPLKIYNYCPNCGAKMDGDKNA